MQAATEAALADNPQPETDGKAARPSGRPTPGWFSIPVAKLLIALGFAAYVFVRVWTLDVTPDEATAGRSYYDVIVVKWVAAQVHCLPDMLARLCFDLLPGHPAYAVRVPSASSFLLDAWAAAGISRLMRRPAMDVLTFTALLANAFVLDFFS